METESIYRQRLDMPVRERKCDVYWGSHGCMLNPGHGGTHICECCECEDHPDAASYCVGREPYYGPDTKFYGDDVYYGPDTKFYGDDVS